MRAAYRLDHQRPGRLLAPAGIARRALLLRIEGIAADARVDRGLDVGGKSVAACRSSPPSGFS
ncbi:MAG TPA: hypothetical protein VNE18_12920, partial [Rhodanobacter sp.]|nr:hypothetical protein [Rhodanobacter sp.]